VTVTSASKGEEPDEPVPIDLEKFGEMVKIRLQGCNKYAGLIRLPVVRKLLDDTALQISATLINARPNQSKFVGKKGPALWYSSTARIVLTGLQEDRSRVGRLLSDSHQFLQHPYAGECGELEYYNPHYLLRPGASMPMLQDTVNFGSASPKPLNSISELNKSRILRIFDDVGLGPDEGNRIHNFKMQRVKSELKQ
jgi:hypothetical protein